MRPITPYLLILFILLSAVVDPADAEFPRYTRADLSGNAEVGLRTPSFSLIQQQEEEKKGGFMTGLRTILYGPRVGIELNDGQPISFVEKANLFVPLVPFQAYSENGWKGFMASAFIGPRVGMQLSQKKIRFKEWVGIIPVAAVAVHIFMSEDPSMGMVVAELTLAGFLSRLWPALDAFRGRTMQEITENENLIR